MSLSAFLAQTWLSGPLIGRLVGQVEEVEEEEEVPTPFSVAVPAPPALAYSPIEYSAD